MSRYRIHVSVRYLLAYDCHQLAVKETELKLAQYHANVLTHTLQISLTSAESKVKDLEEQLEEAHEEIAGYDNWQGDYTTANGVCFVLP